ncbi:MAG: PAS domain S-box protein [Anaerolineae bacterium]|nr:PAS domain S-box protein [Anaerolineae bacterium]
MTASVPTALPGGQGTHATEADPVLRQLAHDLGERVKELDCLYAISRLTLVPGISLPGIFEGTVKLIPRAWQYPDVTCARIIYRDQVFASANFRDSPWKQVSDIAIGGEKVGAVEVAYLEERPPSDEGPFLLAERRLLDAVAERLTEAIQHKQAQEALEASEAKFRSMVQQSPDGIYLTDTQGRIAEWNRALEGIYGLAASETRGRPLWEVQHRALPEEQRTAAALAALEKAVTEALRDRAAPWLHELQEQEIELPDGKRRLVQSIAYLVRTGEAVSIACSVRDVTDLRRMEVALRLTEDRMRLLADHVTESVVYRYRLVPQPGFDYLSPSVRSVTGFAPEEFEAGLDRFLDNVVEEDRLVAEAMARSPETLRGPVALRWRRKDGTVIWLEQRQVPILGPSGEVVAVEGVLSDVTDRRRAQEALRQSERQQELILGAAPVALFRKKARPPFPTLWASDKVRSVTGYPPDRFAREGSFWLSRLHPEDREGVLAQYQRALHLGSVSFEYRWRCADDAYHRFLNRAVLEQGELLVSCIDVSERTRPAGWPARPAAPSEDSGGPAPAWSGWRRLTVMMPATEGATARRPARCPYCGSELLRRHQTVSRLLAGRRSSVEVVRYRCRACDRTFSHRPPGVSRSRQAGETRALVSALYGLGLSLGKITGLLGEAGLKLSRSSAWRMGRAQGEEMRQSRPRNVSCLLPYEDCPAGDELVIVESVNPGDGRRRASMGLLLWGRDDGVYRWLREHLERLGASVSE